MIDDCRDADCPLVELSLSSLHLKQRQDGSGCLTSRLSASYYNRELSAWEPCMEPWGCTVDRISTQLSSKTQRNAVTIKSDEAGRVAGPLVELEDRKGMLVTGGLGEEDEVLASGEFYDVSTGEWSMVSSMVMARTEHVMSLVYGMPTVIGEWSS